MNQKRFINDIILFLGMIALLSSCKSKQAIISNDGSVVKKSQEQLIDDILKAELDYKTISGKVSLEFISGNKTSGMKVNSRLKIVRDDIIQLSVLAPFINSELFRLNITPDSVFVIDRMSKKYGAEDISKFEKERNIQFNYNNLQALFTNSLFAPGKKSVSRSDYGLYTTSQNSSNYHIVTKDKSGFVYDFTVDSNDRIVGTGIVHDKNDEYSMNWIYDDFIKEGIYMYPTKTTTEVNIGKKPVKLIMSNSGLDINKKIEVDKSMPSKYERVSVIDILKKYIR